MNDFMYYNPVRVHFGADAMSCLPEELGKALQPKCREEITSKFKSFGFAYVTLDLLGYRTGSMNEVLAEK